jgi:hypothetical protein
MFGGAPASLCALHQGVEQAPQQGRLPALARPQQVFERAAQLAHFAHFHLLVAGAEDAVDAPDGIDEAGRQGAALVFRILLRVVFPAAQLELEPPALAAAILGHAMHFQRADLGQRCRQLHRDLGRRSLAGARARART